MKTHCVNDIHGDQIEVDGQWYHAQRVFGKPADQYSLGQRVEQLAQAGGIAPGPNTPDEWVSCELYRGCSSNAMTPSKADQFAQAMLSAGGWGAFPMITGYVEVLDTSDVEHCKDLVAQGRADVWTQELGWSRLVTAADLGARYVHIDNGHHRMAAAALASLQLRPVHGAPIAVPVADLKREEDSPRFVGMKP